MIKSIIFDWGGVLIDNPADGLIDFCASSLGVASSKLKAEFSKFESKFQKGTISETDLWKKICNHLNIKRPGAPSLWREAVNHVFQNKKDVYKLLVKLKANGYKVGFLSNTEISTMRYFYDNGYDKYFDVATFSCIEKSVKSESKIFNIALKKLGSKPQETIFIDDKPKYIESAMKLGIIGIVFDDCPSLVVKLKALSVNIN